MRLHWMAVATLLHGGVTACARQGPMQQGPTAASVAPRPAERPPPEPSKAPPRAQAAGVDSLRLEAALLRRHAHAPLAQVLRRRGGNPTIADRAATAVLRESRRLRLSPSLIAAVLLVENTPMDTTALSLAGAIGLMQVMPVHGGAMGCPSPGLLEVEANICHGTRVLKMYLRRTRTVRAALQRYNGCVGALRTRRCLRYPARVLRMASRIRREMLAAPAPVAPPSPPPPPYLAARPQPSPAPPSLSGLPNPGP
jgi:soluble lytic murein transglycosylase-like protein